MLVRIISGVAFFVSAVLGFILWILLTTPDAKKINECLVTRMYKVSLCDKKGQYVALQNVSPYLKDLILIAEDAAFYSHNGFDWTEMHKSLNTNLSSRKFSRGGSTITQQLAKNVFLEFDKTLPRKIREAILTYELEKILSKNKIFEKYLNVIELGQNIFGVKAAAQFYFKKDVRDLNILEAAFITYLVPNPRGYAKVYFHGSLTPYSRFRILDLCYRLYRFKKITYEQYLAAKEYVDRFPWTELDPVALNRLSGLDVEPSSPDIEAEPVPEADVEVPYVEPSVEDEQIIPQKEGPSAEEDDSPFQD